MKLVQDEDARELSRAGAEVWAPYPETDSYLVSNMGRVFNQKTNKFLDLSLGKHGYVCRGDDLVHRAVVRAFEMPDLDLTMVVDHDDDNRANNALFNLVVMTRRENADKAMKKGRLRHRSGPIPPLPEDSDAVLRSVVAGVITPGEASKILVRSSSWVWSHTQKILNVREPDPPLDEESRHRAVKDAAAIRETFWRTWPERPWLEVSNLGNVRWSVSKVAVTPGKSGVKGYRSVLTGGNIYVAVIKLYGEPKPGPEFIIRHFPMPCGADPLCDAAHNLIWGTYGDNARDSITQGLIPRGSDHGRAVLTETGVKEGLERFVAEKWTIARLSDFLDQDSRNVCAILEGRSWAHVPRPEGLQAHLDTIGREGEKHHNWTGATAEDIQRGLGQYTKNHWSAAQFAGYLKIGEPVAQQILRGHTWRGVRRPLGFMYPWPDAHSLNRVVGSSHHATALTEKTVEEALQGIVDGTFSSVKETASFLGLTRGNTWDILKGKTWAHVPRPLGLTEAIARVSRTPRLEAETIEAIVSRLRRGEPPKELQAAYELTDDQIGWYAQKAGAQKKKIDRALKASIIERMEAGDDPHALQVEFGLTKNQLHKYRAEAGLSKEAGRRLTNEEVVAALALYVQNQWSGPQFSEHLQVSIGSGHRILSGEGHKHLPRPEGFQYPWPAAESRYSQGRPDRKEV